MDPSSIKCAYRNSFNNIDDIPILLYSYVDNKQKGTKRMIWSENS
ncbi:unnamed protein product, partial [marine sediment metagenome]